MLDDVGRLHFSGMEAHLKDGGEFIRRDEVIQAWQAADGLAVEEGQGTAVVAAVQKGKAGLRPPAGLRAARAALARGSLTGGRPPFSLGVSRLGISGSIRFHSSSGTSGFAMMGPPRAT
jgi:hypothetical protein